MDVLQAIYELSEAIRTSEPFAELRRAYEQVQRDPTAHQLFARFRTLQKQLQQKQISGLPVSDADMELLQQHLHVIEMNENIARLIHAEERLNELFAQAMTAMIQPIEQLYDGHS
ncbi:YlbF family regulator [Anoxybacillus eryuanensis]|uniref:YlbF family regulator n=1 Tax=Anoxybacillus eryuanensis TaxID=651866 RepID=UPI003EF8BB98